MAHYISDFLKDTEEHVQRAWKDLKKELGELFPDDESDAKRPYEYDYDTPLKPWPMLKTDPSFPSEQEPVPEWYFKVVSVVLGLVVNRIAWPADPSSTDAVDHKKVKIDLSHIGVGTVSGQGALVSDDAIRTMAKHDKTNSEGEEELRRVANALRKKFVFDPWHIFQVLMQAVNPKPHGRPKSLNDYNSLFVTKKPPALSENYTDNKIFADLRVAGYNPVVIKAVSKLPHNFPVTNAMLAEATTRDDTLAVAGKEGRLFLADYSTLSTVEMGNFPSGPKYLFAPLALFTLPPGTGTRRLVPVAIQCGPDPDRYPVLTPSQKDLWSRARKAVEQADVTHQELNSHLAGCHLLMEPFAIATHNKLAADHPIGHLLTPHFEGTLFINEGALKALVSGGGQIAKELAPTPEASNHLTVQPLITGEYFNDNMLPTQLKKRGVMSKDLYYPYRDDALDVWYAIHEWVRSYVAIFYKNDSAVKNDPDLRSWARELVSDNGGRMKGFGEKDSNGVLVPGQLTTVEYLVEVLTMIIFTASAGHATFNFAQSVYMNYTPAVPEACYRTVPVDEHHARVMPVLDQLPPLEIARMQMETMSLLGSVHHTRLGYYGDEWPQNGRVREAMVAFQEKLDDVKVKIENRNLSRSPEYKLLLPPLIPQSINI